MPFENPNINVVKGADTNLDARAKRDYKRLVACFKRPNYMINNEGRSSKGIVQVNPN